MGRAANCNQSSVPPRAERFADDQIGREAGGAGLGMSTIGLRLSKTVRSLPSPISLARSLSR